MQLIEKLVRLLFISTSGHTGGTVTRRLHPQLDPIPSSYPVIALTNLF